MFKFAITVSLMLIAMLFAACGGDTPEPAGQDAEEVGTEARAAAGSGTSTQTGEARQPTPAPRATERAPSTSGQGSSASPAGAPSEAAPTPRAAGPTAAVPASGSLPTAAPVSQAETQPSEPGGSDSLVPADPRFTDEVLLQDIYAKIDLDQFALDPDEPIAFEYEAGPVHGAIPVSIYTDKPLESLMEHPTVHEHPFLHLFPSLENQISEQDGTGSLQYSPTAGNLFQDRGRFGDFSANRNGITNFIYHPWFRPVHPGERTVEYGERILPGDHPIDGEPGPFWFGENSTKGVLLETVARLIEEARAPGAEPTQRAWWNTETLEWKHRDRPLELREWTIEEFLSVSVHSHKEIRIRRGAEEFRGINMHITPQVEWEIIHPQLPIIRVTVHSSHALPLNPAGTGQKASYSLRTAYSVSFVMSFQNRWTSFEDPNRWIIRFREDLDIYHAPPWQLDEELPYPRYWDDTDYMQHRIIGPVVMTVHEPAGRASSTVLQPGNYSMEPRVAGWAAPGHILTDRQVPTIERALVRATHLGREEIERPDDPGLRTWSLLPDTNAGLPLPGHILVTPNSGPGTDFWREKDMDGNDW